MSANYTPDALYDQQSREIRQQTHAQDIYRRDQEDGGSGYRLDPDTGADAGDRVIGKDLEMQSNRNSTPCPRAISISQVLRCNQAVS